MRPWAVCGTTPQRLRRMPYDTSMIFTSHINATMMSGMMRLPRNFRLSALLSMSRVLSRIVPLQRSEKMEEGLVDYHKLLGCIAYP